MQISASFDSGNIEVLDASQREEVRLAIRKDAGEDHYQWFHYRVTGAEGNALTMHLVNAAGASYPGGWRDYRAVASYDRVHWFRVPTRYDGVELAIEHTPERSVVYYAYFTPYSLERHADLIGRVQCAPGVSCERLGSTVDGRDLDLLRVEPLSPSADKTVWVIARQHPGETMAEWLVEGLLERLLDPDDPVSRELRHRARFFVVPNMNPDGSYRGHLRNNAAGANLNRQWAEPTEDRSPEVFFTRAQMEQTGVDLFLDVHGDEALPYNFIAGADGVPSWTEEAERRQQRYLEALVRASPDFQTEKGYPKPPRGEANLTMATNWVGERFGCLSMTLEQPFKDTAKTPHPEGWSGERAKRLGAANLDAMWAQFAE